MLDIDMISRIFRTIERGLDFGIDIRVLRERIDEANAMLNGIGAELVVSRTGAGTVTEDRTVITDATVSVLFFDPRMNSGHGRPTEFMREVLGKHGWYSALAGHEPGIDADMLDAVLDKIPGTLEPMGIGIDLDVFSAMSSKRGGKTRVLSIDTSITFKNKE